MLSNLFSFIAAIACIIVSVHSQQYNDKNQRRALQNTVRRSRASIFELQDEAEVCDIFTFDERRRSTVFATLMNKQLTFFSI